MSRTSGQRGERDDGTRRRALVTGANGGLGRAIVERLAAEGYDVVTMDISSPATMIVDLANDELPLDALADIDVCVSNAGIVDILSPAHRMSVAKWDRDLAVNLTASFRVVQACLGGMRARRDGRIIIMSSLAAALGSPGQVAYSASKAGLIGMARAIAAENAALGITANCILPGMIATPKVLGMPAATMEAVLDHGLPSGRFGQPAEVAALVAYLGSDEAGYVTGQSIIIDGGTHLGNLALGNPAHRE
jgi:NAD(P)-dependent dehydrogenase (short-subunit alcohol dehydrogenase family)